MASNVRRRGPASAYVAAQAVYFGSLVWKKILEGCAWCENGQPSEFPGPCAIHDLLCIRKMRRKELLKKRTHVRSNNVPSQRMIPSTDLLQTRRHAGMCPFLWHQGMLRPCTFTPQSHPAMRVAQSLGACISATAPQS